MQILNAERIGIILHFFASILESITKELVQLHLYNVTLDVMHYTCLLSINFKENV